nr:DoxX family protein [Sphingomonas sp. CDS-1]
MDNWPLRLAQILALLFVLNSLANLANLKILREEFTRWRLPSWFRFFNATWQLATAALLVIPATLPFGLAMGFAVCAGIFLIVGVRAREASHCLPGLVLALLLAAVALGTW